MILQRLAEYYQRADELPKFGWIRRRVDYLFVLDQEGQCVHVEALSDHAKKNGGQSELLVPAIGKQALKHTMSGKDANLLWDNSAFTLGIGKHGERKLASFLDAIAEWGLPLDDPGIQAVDRFCRRLQANPKVGTALLAQFNLADAFDKRDPCIAFRLISDVEPIFSRPGIRQAYAQALDQRHAQGQTLGICLVSGQQSTPIAKNETVIKGVYGGQPSGGNIVSFNARSFESYGKRQRGGENAPISLAASFAYTTALNHLLKREQGQRVQVGDTSTVFWAEQPNTLETALPDIFGEPPKDDPSKGARAIAELYRAVESGHFSTGEGEDRFHVLGLAPNAARISIRFWETAPALELAQRIRQHFEDLRIARGPNDPEYLSLFRLLVNCAQQGKADNIPPNLGGDVMRAILSARPYPSTLLHAAVQRCRAEQRVTYPRAAAIKAWLCRDWQRAGTDSLNPAMELKPMLDLVNPSPAYRLGRLFATLERIQEEASPGINATIRDRFYGAASGTPVSVFPTLMRLKNHHIGKLAKGRAVNMERLIAEILSGLADFPNQMPMPEQGRFAIGYYHQRQAFFTKRTPTSDPTEPTPDSNDSKETDA